MTLVDVSLGDHASYFSVAFEHSFQIYQCNPVKRKQIREFVNLNITHVTTTPDGNITVFSTTPMQPSSDLYVVYIWSNFFGQVDDQLEFEEPIQGLIIRCDYLLVIFLTSVVVHNMSTHQKIMEQVTYDNPNGCGDFYSIDSTNRMAICGLVPGALQIISVGNEGRPVFIQAHEHNLSRVKFSPDGSLIATASEEGTIIRLFDCLTGSMLCEFRRGHLPKQIVGLGFGFDNTYLIAMSSNGTVHVFDARSKQTSSSISKISFPREKAVEISYLSETEFIMVGLSGIMRLFKVINGQITEQSSTLFLAH